MQSENAGQESPNAGSLPAVLESSSANLRKIDTSLKHWKMFHAVAECGSFATAADHLHVSQATVSYTIARLEETLGVSLLKLEGRKYRLTQPGIELLKRSRFLLNEAVALEKFAGLLREGAQPEIKLAIARDFPTRLLMPALRRFSSHWRHAKLSVLEVSTADVERILYNREADIAINTSVPSGFQGDLFIGLEYVAVASPEHPLFRLGRSLLPDDLNGHVQIISLTECAPNAVGQSQVPGTAKQWYVSNFETAITAFVEAIGYGWVPRQQIQQLLDTGQLKVLPLEESASFAQHFYLIRGRSAGYTNNTEQLFEVLQSVAADVKKED